MIAMRIKLVCLAHVGRIEDAREWLKRALAIQPGLTVAVWKASFAATAFSPELRARYVDSLREAGLPEE
jgi:hypothetical protein